MGRTLEIDERWRDQIVALLNGMEFGSVLITVHDGKIVQLERTERKRFELNYSPPPSPSERLTSN
ncbi:MULTISPECIES: YezD family protein [Paenibacillus]|uniref:YezD family protein n=1 Tax=Paenibacillus TaxID=44249 RepID=UPI0003747A8F|nr:YezD family protein [Paenibacillus terrigena]